MAGLIEAAKTEQQREAAARLFLLWESVGIALPADARGFLVKSRAPINGGVRKGVSPYLLTSLQAAAHSKAGAEVILRALALTNGDAYALTAQEAQALVKSLVVLGQDDAARALAMEATGYWRAAL